MTVPGQHNDVVQFILVDMVENTISIGTITVPRILDPSQPRWP